MAFLGWWWTSSKAGSTIWGCLVNWFCSPWSHPCPCFPYQGVWCPPMDRVKHISGTATWFTMATREHARCVCILRLNPTGVDTYPKLGQSDFLGNLKLGADTEPGSPPKLSCTIVNSLRSWDIVPMFKIWQLSCHHKQTRLRTQAYTQGWYLPCAKSSRPTLDPSPPKQLISPFSKIPQYLPDAFFLFGLFFDFSLKLAF